MKKVLVSSFVTLFILAILLAPGSSFAAGLVPCGSATTHPCNFDDVLTMIHNINQFILLQLAIPIAAIMFVYAGFKMVTSGGSTEARGQAKKIFTNTVYGILFVAGGWLIVKTILSILGYQHIGLFFG